MHFTAEIAESAEMKDKFSILFFSAFSAFSAVKLNLQPFKILSQIAGIARFIDSVARRISA